MNNVLIIGLDLNKENNISNINIDLVQFRIIINKIKDNNDL